MHASSLLKRRRPYNLWETDSYKSSTFFSESQLKYVRVDMYCIFIYTNKIQSTLVISNSKGLSEILRDIRSSTYQICRLEEKINRTTAFNKCICNWTLEVKHMLKILWKRGEIAP